MPSQEIDMGASMETEAGLAIIDALNEVTDVQTMEGANVTFEAEDPQPLACPDHLRAVQLYRCARGLLLFFQEQNGPHWAIAVPRRLL